MNPALKIVFILTAFFMATKVEAATSLDLTGSSAHGTINGALFSRTAPHGQGSGVFRPFVRLGVHKGSAYGYNTDAAKSLMYGTTKWNPIFTHSILLSDIPVINHDYVIAFNGGDSGGRDYTLANLDLYLLSTKDVSGPPSSFPFAPSYTMETGDPTYNSVLLGNIKGQGVADMYVDVPTSDFNKKQGKYLYLYSNFTGDKNGTFQSWGTIGKPSDQSVVPEPATLALFAVGLLTISFYKRKYM